MRFSCAILAIVFAAAISGCGGTSATSTSGKSTSKTESAGATATTERETRHPVPEVPPHKGPLKKLVVRDVKVGKGPEAHWGDEVSVRYVGVYYETGKIYSQHWNLPLDFKLDGKSISVGWQRAIEGMKVGGRREALIPGRLLFEDDVAYVITLVRVDPKAR